jgi:sialate O-acetylesterase
MGCRMQRFLVVSVLALGAAAQAPQPTFRTSALFGDHMVMPARSQLPLRGRGVAGEPVVVTASWGANAKTEVDGEGRWQCSLATPARGASGEVTLRSGGAELVLRDLLAGDVWLCSGQSNMEMPVGRPGQYGVRNQAWELVRADVPSIRVFTVTNRTANTPTDELEGRWQRASADSIAPTSAVAWFFARGLHEAGQGPIGLVVSSWGGTVAEAWMSAEGLAAFPEFAAQLAAQRADAAAASRTAAVQAFWRALDAVEYGEPQAVQVPDRWSSGPLAAFDGVAVYEREVALPAELQGRPLWLELGAIDDMDTVSWRGVRLDGHEDEGDWATPRRYRIDAAAAGSAAASLQVRVVDTGGEGGFTAPADALRLVVDPADAKSPSLALAGEWQRRRGPAMSALPRWPARQGGPNRPAVLWNGMIAPLLPFPFTGALWYQGESNRGRAEQYETLFPALITDWRRALGAPVPFYFVQIAPYGYSDDADDRTARLRLAQARALELPATGMVVTLDCGDADDIHPIDKQPVGARLAALALARHYGVAVPCTGPVLSAIAAEGAAVRLRFAEAANGLRLANDGAGFELGAADGRFVAARAVLDGDVVVLQADGVTEPKFVRYAWGAVPKWSLHDGAGLPAAPFHRAIR